MSEEEYRKTFVRKLNYYMNINHKSQKDLMDELGLSSATISSWVNGKKLPRMGKIQMLADYFNINKSDLLEEKPETTYLDRLDHETLGKLNESNLHKVNVYSKKLLDLQLMEEEEPTAPVLMAAHNDSATDPEEQEKIYRDLAKLKKPNS